MPLNYEKLINWKAQDLEHRYSANDCILYALGIGLGHDPLDQNGLSFVYEKNLRTLPTMATILAYPWGWLHQADADITRVKLVHAEQGIHLHRPIPSEGELVGDTEVTNIIDKGAEKGALIYSERKVRDKQSGELIFTATATTFCRADGGFNGPTGPLKSVEPVPEREPDAVCDLPTLPQAALIYRLCGDRNPLHIEPEVGRRAGFQGPILHGLCTYGVAGHAILKTLCDYDETRLVSLDARFSAPVYPGEVIRTEMWREGDRVHFRALVPARGSVVLNNGVARLRN
jgi:acyl dehydratase